jgi:hypothetical protein
MQPPSGTQAPDPGAAVDPDQAPGRDPDGLPDHLRTSPTSRVRWEFPTPWLLGAKLLSSLGDILLSSLFEFDPRDWMSPDAPIDLTSKIEPETAQDDAACWIDFFADTGDSPRLVYQLAYLLQQDSLEVVDRKGHPMLGRDGARRRLPRGCALIIGGDIAYPVSTRARLVERIRAPFLWARRHLLEEGKLSTDRPAIPLLAIPGNHDYYNLLDGYQRQFRARGAGMADESGRPVPGRDLVRDPHLALPGYERRQDASYFALRLPFDWDLWALDIERGTLDERQRGYFLSLPPPAGGAAPKRVVVTSRPGFVYHAPNVTAPGMARIFESLGLEPAFLRNGRLSDPQALRLDLAGDEHVYERYWGATLAPGVEAPSHARGNETQPQAVTPPCQGYASVVSGLGGAFHHPAQLRFGHVAPRSDWPGMKRSAAAIGERLLRPRKVFQAGSVGIIGGLVSLLGLALVWLAGKERGGGVMDIPFALRDWTADRLTSARNLETVASIMGALVVSGVAIHGGVKGCVRLIAPIQAGVASGWWARLTRWISHAELTFWLLRWFGGSRRNLWAALIAAPAWAPMVFVVCGISYALLRFADFKTVADGFVPLYVAIVLLVTAMVALAGIVGGLRYRRVEVTRARAIVGHVVLVAFGALIGALIVWTPYAWMRLVVHGRLGVGWGLVLVCGYMPMHRALIAIRFLYWKTRRRRLFALIAFAAVCAWAVALPIAFTHVECFTQTPLPGWVVLPSVVFGAYFTCLWIGWYFLLCLQWNVHGNEAGTAARVAIFALFVRIKLTADAAEVWTIAPEPPARRRSWLARWRPSIRGDQAAFADLPLRARVVDHFVVRRDPAPR